MSTSARREAGLPLNRPVRSGEPAGPTFARVNLRSHCEVGERLGQRLRLPTRACEGLWFVFERWDGKGMRAGVRGTRIPIAARVLHAARDAAAFARLRDGKVDYFRGSEDTAVTAQAFAAG